MDYREIKVDSVMKAIKWAKHTLLVVVSTPSGSPERRAKLDELARATSRARELASSYRGKLSTELQVGLQMTEMALARFRLSPEAAAEAAAEAARATAPAKKRPRVHPRRVLAGA